MDSKDIKNKLSNSNTVSNDGNSKALMVIMNHFEVAEIQYFINLDPNNNHLPN